MLLTLRKPMNSALLPAVLLLLVLMCSALYATFKITELYHFNASFEEKHTQIKLQIKELLSLADILEHRLTALEQTASATDPTPLQASLTDVWQQTKVLSSLVLCPREKTFYFALLAVEDNLRVNVNQALSAASRAEGNVIPLQQSVRTSMDMMTTAIYRLQTAVHQRKEIDNYVICADEQPR
ncbi:hypothetical protein WH50_22565 [Pokkaliibacter plantistimulans]|uniref:Chemotaxis methyl-accepting receptor HlyB-like 4HB MCP domain-containing protein n=1 Tax=Pokkaliibacter plantistimulans TaxID=1635171 RepID=A0ABX5LR14_9GAMM|nr:hypothetical protein [Pokkaliibacter plantistimulans]PXF29104.1 hypothetical protein WH50_22565 [Pokkaliibacter plantistimulans]